MSVCVMEYYPAIKKKHEIMPFAETWMDFEIIIAKVNQLEKHKQHMISLMWNLKKKTMIQINLFTKHKQAHRHRKQSYGY